MIRASLIALACAGPAAAQQPPNCGPYDAVAAALSQRWGEQRQSHGLTTDEAGQIIALIEIWTNFETGSFTVLMVRPDKTACIAASGGTFENVQALPKGDAL